MTAVLDVSEPLVTMENYHVKVDISSSMSSNSCNQVIVVLVIQVAVLVLFKRGY